MFAALRFKSFFLYISVFPVSYVVDWSNVTGDVGISVIKTFLIPPFAFLFLVRTFYKIDLNLVHSFEDRLIL